MGKTNKPLDHHNKINNDEFYTTQIDIEKELLQYGNQLEGKNILCPCDWDYEYNLDNKYIKYKHTIDTFFKSNDILQLDLSTPPHNVNNLKSQFVYTLLSLKDKLKFKSLSICGYNPYTAKGIRFQDIDNWQDYDVIITNPPFSYFGDFVKLLIKNKKEFIIIGPMMFMASPYSFQCFKDDKLHLGYTFSLSTLRIPDGTFLEGSCSLCRTCTWYTNLIVDKDVYIPLTEKYDKQNYPSYENFDAIEVSKVKMIPKDYDGLMSVPITFLRQYNKHQFSLISMSKFLNENPYYLKENKKIYPFERIIIKKIIN